MDGSSAATTRAQRLKGNLPESTSPVPTGPKKICIQQQQHRGVVYHGSLLTVIRRAAARFCCAGGDARGHHGAHQSPPSGVLDSKSGGLSRSECWRRNTINTLPQKTNYHVHVGYAARVTQIQIHAKVRVSGESIRYGRVGRPPVPAAAVAREGRATRHSTRAFGGFSHLKYSSAVHDGTAPPRRRRTHGVTLTVHGQASRVTSGAGPWGQGGQL